MCKCQRVTVTIIDHTGETIGAIGTETYRMGRDYTMADAIELWDDFSDDSDIDERRGDVILELIQG